MTKLDHNAVSLAKEAVAKQIATAAGKSGKSTFMSAIKQLLGRGGKAVAAKAPKAVPPAEAAAFFAKKKGPGLLKRLGKGLALTGAGAAGAGLGLGAYKLHEDAMSRPMSGDPLPGVTVIRDLQQQVRDLKQRRDADAGPTWSPQEHRQFSRFGMDPTRLKFIQTLGNLRSGMNLERQLMRDAMAGGLAPNLFGGEQEDDQGNLEAYA